AAQVASAVGNLIARPPTRKNHHRLRRRRGERSRIHFRKLVRLESPSSGSFSVEHFRTSLFIRISGFEFRHFSNACLMLASAKRRPCCFDRSGFYSKSLSAPRAAS